MKTAFLFLLPVLALPVGIGAGVALRPVDHGETEQSGEADVQDPAEAPEYVKLTNQFVVPILADGQVVSLVILMIFPDIALWLPNAIYTK